MKQTPRGHYGAYYQAGQADGAYQRMGGVRLSAIPLADWAADYARRITGGTGAVTYPAAVRDYLAGFHAGYAQPDA